jgi:Fe2+ transport system protein FeoA
VVPLTELEPGEEAEIKYLSTTDNARLAHLTSLGIAPGQSIILLRKRPAYVVQVDTSTISFGAEVARQIYVRPVKQAVEINKGWRFRWRRR